MTNKALALCLMRYPKVDGSVVARFLNWTPIFDWNVDQRGSKNKHHKDTCLKVIGQRLQILTTTLCSTMNTLWRTYVSI